MKLSELNTTLEIINDAEFECLGYAVDDTKKTFLTFLYNEYFVHKILSNKFITAVVTTLEVAEILLKEKPSLGILISASPKDHFYDIHNTLYKSGFYKTDLIKSHISPTATLHPSVNLLGDNIFIGDNTVIDPNVTIYDNVSIGANCTIQAGVVLGSQNPINYTDKNHNKIIARSIGTLMM